MNESTSNKDVKNLNGPLAGGMDKEESKKNDQQFGNMKNIQTLNVEKLKRGLSGYQNPSNENKEDEKVPDVEEKKENTLHGPDSSIFIKNQKISNKESLNQKKYYFQKNITKEQEEAEIKAKKEKEKKEREKARQKKK